MRRLLLRVRVPTEYSGVNQSRNWLASESDRFSVRDDFRRFDHFEFGVEQAPSRHQHARRGSDDRGRYTADRRSQPVSPAGWTCSITRACGVKT